MRQATVLEPAANQLPHDIGIHASAVSIEAGDPVNQVITYRSLMVLPGGRRAILRCAEASLMEQPAWACTRCSRTIGPGDTILFGTGGLSHVDCRRPRVLSTEERALLFIHCCDHAIECAPCAGSVRLSELGSDLRGHTNLCPHCRQDLTDSVRAHLYKCDMVSEEVRHWAQAVRAASERLVKASCELGVAADVLRREVEAALQALQEAMRTP